MSHTQPKKLAIVGALLLALTAPLTACGSDTQTGGTSSAPASESKAAKAPADLTGAWKSSPSDTGAHYTAEVTGTTITVTIANDESKTKALYWAGTYAAPTAPGDYAFDSKNDLEQTKNSLLGSPDETKTFTYNESAGTLSFDFSMSGVTQTIEMKKS